MNIFPTTRPLHLFILIALGLLAGCSKEEEEVISWRPVEMGDGLQVSSAAAQGVDSLTIDNTYRRAQRLDNLYSLLILKSGYLIAEG